MNYCLFDDMPYYCNRTGTIDINAIGLWSNNQAFI